MRSGRSHQKKTRQLAKMNCNSIRTVSRALFPVKIINEYMYIENMLCLLVSFLL